MVDDLRMEVNHWKLRFEDAQKQLAMLKRDQQQIMGSTHDNLNHMHRIHTHNTTLHSMAELEGLRNLELQVARGN